MLAGRSMSFTQTKLQRDFPGLQLDSWKVCSCLKVCHTMYYWNPPYTTLTLSLLEILMHELQFIVLLCYFPACTDSQHCCLWQHVIFYLMTRPIMSCKQRCCVAAVASRIPHQLQVCAPQAAGPGHASHCFLLVRGLLCLHCTARHISHLVGVLMRVCLHCLHLQLCGSKPMCWLYCMA